jgi:hypothetical protein
LNKTNEKQVREREREREREKERERKRERERESEREREQGDLLLRVNGTQLPIIAANSGAV